MLAPFADPLLQQERSLPLLPLVGRSVEMQFLHNLLAAVLHDSPSGARAITISGETGIGKTRLLTEAAHQAKAQGFEVLEMQAYESSSTFPYFPFVEALRPMLHKATSEQLHFYVSLSSNKSPSHVEPSATGILVLPGTALVAALAHLFPELPSLVRVETIDERVAPEQEKFRLFDAIAFLLERLALSNPLLVCFDNLQWADSASQELLLYLTIRLHTSRIALLGATRPLLPTPKSDDQQGLEAAEARKAAETATRVLTELAQRSIWSLLPLGPLDDETIIEHLHALLPGQLPANVIEALATRAEGSPFFLEELVRGLTLNKQLYMRDNAWHLKHFTELKLPTSILVAVHQRLQGLSPTCLKLLRVAALFGRAFPVDALLHVLAQEERGDALQKALDEAVRASLLMETSDSDENTTGALNIAYSGTTTRYMFCQNIVQEVLRTEVAGQQAHSLHLAIGQALEQSYAHNAAQHAAELAMHYATGGDKKASLRWSILAGEQALRQQAHRQAISHFRLAIPLIETDSPGLSDALTLPTPAQLHLAIGELWFKLGQLDSAIRSFHQALDQISVQEELFPLLRARMNRGLADAYRMQAKYEQALAHLHATSAIIDQQQLSPRKGQEQPWFFKQVAFNGLLVYERIESVERVLYLQSLAMLDMLLNHTQEAEEALWRSHKLATVLGDRNGQAFALHLIGWLCGWGERIHEAIRLLEQSHELYLLLGDPFRAALGAHGLGSIYQALGETETARHYIQRGLALARQYGVRGVLGWLYHSEGTLALLQGAWERCAASLEAALREAEMENNARLKPALVQVQAESYFRRGLWSEAEQRYRQAIELAKNTDWFASSVALYGHFLAVTGRRTAASAQLDRASQLPEYAGFSGSFYIPFLVEGYLHLEMPERALPYLDRVKKLRGFLYYGYSVDRILGELATTTKDWQQAERAFEDGLQLCRRTHNEPEEAAILYEQARMAIMRSEPLSTIRSLCNQARELFLRHGMERSATLVSTLLEGVQTLNGAREKENQPRAAKGHTVSVTTADHVLHLKLSAREREVLLLVAEGHTDREIADTLVLSHRTVHRHLSNIFVKLDVPGRAAAVAYAIRHGLV